MLDTDAEGSDSREVADIVLRIEPGRDLDRARKVYETHLSRAKWLSNHGYEPLLKYGWPASN